MDQNVSERLLDQRLRNRMCEVVLMLVEWEDTLATIGPNEYFNTFVDCLPDEQSISSNSTLTDDERSALIVVLNSMFAADRSTPDTVTAEELIASGWPQKIEIEAAKAYDLLLARGLFSEDEEEADPSRPAQAQGLRQRVL